MVDPLFWLGLSILLVAVSLTAVLVAALPALRELARAARSAEKLFDTLSREVPPTLEAIRLTGMEISDLTDDISENVQSAGRMMQQVDQGFSGVKQQARQAQVTTRSVFAGVKAAWRTFSRPASGKRRSGMYEETFDRLPGDSRLPVEFDDSYEEFDDPFADSLSDSDDSDADHSSHRREYRSRMDNSPSDLGELDSQESYLLDSEDVAVRSPNSPPSGQLPRNRD